MTTSARKTVLLLVLLWAGPALAGGDAAIGKTKAVTCVPCHGEDGRGIAPNYPVLAGQHADYLAHTLRQYRSGERKNPIMLGIASALSDADIDDLSAWFASLEGLETAAH
jgi:cytochrome c553